MMFGELRGRRVLVTGGSGFIGGQLVARLANDCEAGVRALVRRYGSAARIARFPVELVLGDIASAEDVDRAVAGCDVVFHCAYGKDGDNRSRKQTTIAGVENILAAARRHRVSRVVYVSTVSVYGDLTTPELDETAPRRLTGDTYGDSKVEAEKAAFRHWHEYKVPVAIVQPTIVYGPFGSTFTTRPLEQMRTGRFPLINGGTGRCNAVYVDDVVSAMLRAAVVDKAVGEAFLISGPEAVTWREFYGAYERMLGVSATVSMTPDEALAHYHASRSAGPMLFGESLRLLSDPGIRERLVSTRDGAILARGLRRLLPRGVQRAVRARVKHVTAPPIESGMPVHAVRPARIRLFASPTVVRTDKAARLLGYRPQFDLAAGMSITRQWARWANLIA